MVNFKLGEEIRKDGIFNMSRARDKENIYHLQGTSILLILAYF